LTLIKALKKVEEPKIPEKTKFFLKNANKLEFVSSFLTKGEIMRELVLDMELRKRL